MITIRFLIKIVHWIPKICATRKNIQYEDINQNTIKLKSIHYPNHPIGGGEQRCALQHIMMFKSLYPEMPFERHQYYLFTYEELYILFDRIKELKEICKEFCHKRNSSGNVSYNIRDGKEAAVTLINREIDSVGLRVLNDNTLDI